MCFFDVTKNPLPKHMLSIKEAYILVQKQTY